MLDKSTIESYIIEFQNVRVVSTDTKDIAYMKTGDSISSESLFFFNSYLDLYIYTLQYSLLWFDDSDVYDEDNAPLSLDDISEIISRGKELVFLLTGTALTDNALRQTQVEVTFPVPNSGGGGTTDWVDTNLDGLADYYTLSVATPTLVTGNGFTGRAQRFDINTPLVDNLLSDDFDLPYGKYKLRMKYRSSVTLGFTFQLNGVNYNPPLNIGDAVEVESPQFNWGGGDFQLNMLMINTGTANYFELDEAKFVKQ
jgi:hypothetical protein